MFVAFDDRGALAGSDRRAACECLIEEGAGETSLAAESLVDRLDGDGCLVCDGGDRRLAVAAREEERSSRVENRRSCFECLGAPAAGVVFACVFDRCGDVSDSILNHYRDL